MKHYETIFIINPNLSEEEYAETLTKFRDLIDKLKGIMIKVEEWGKQKLAYPLMKFDSGVYVLFDYCGDAGMTIELERILKLDEKILKYQTIKLADQADPEALIQKEEESRKERPVKADEGTSPEVEETAEVDEPTELGKATQEEESAEANGSAEADGSAEAKEAPAEVEEVSAKGNEMPEDADAVPEKLGEEPVETGEEPAKLGKAQDEDEAAEKDDNKEN